MTEDDKIFKSERDVYSVKIEVPIYTDKRNDIAFKMLTDGQSVIIDALNEYFYYEKFVESRESMSGLDRNDLIKIIHHMKQRLTKLIAKIELIEHKE